MQKFFIILRFVITITFGVIVIFCLQIYGQSYNQQAQVDVGSIPVELRSRFFERLKLLIHYQFTEQWDKEYDLLDISLSQEEDKEMFIRKSQHYSRNPKLFKIRDFYLTNAIMLYDRLPEKAEWTIFGCAEYLRKGQITKVKAGMTAIYCNGDWFFSEISSVTQVDGPEQPCLTSEPNK